MGLSLSRLRDRWGYVQLRFRHATRLLTGPKLLRSFADAYPEAFFIEIGAHDGTRSTALRPFIISRSWSGILVEPAPRVFERLRKNYAGVDRVALENVAIGERDGRLPFYELAEVNGENRLPEWSDRIGSLSREHILTWSTRLPDIERHIVRTDIPCLTFESLCRKHSVQGVDLLVVDTEGHDYEIIKQIDFDAHRPRLLVFEHLHLSPAELEECLRLLNGRGYQTMAEYWDTWCLDTRPDDRLTRSWRDLVRASRHVLSP